MNKTLAGLRVRRSIEVLLVFFFVWKGVLFLTLIFLAYVGPNWSNGTTEVVSDTGQFLALFGGAALAMLVFNRKPKEKVA